MSIAMFKPWSNTLHATAAARKIDGLVTSHFSESCLPCHTTGYSLAATAQTAANGGFYYEEKNEKGGPDGGLWAYPNPMLPTSYATMVAGWPTLGDLGGIQCENCHGPAGGMAAANHNASGTAGQQVDMFKARVDWSEQVCASCHQEAKTHYLPGEWSQSEHGSYSTAIKEGAVESHQTNQLGAADPQWDKGTQFCARCHSAQGFAHFAAALKNGATSRYDYITTDDQKLGATNAPTVPWMSAIGLNQKEVQPITCQACHDPHSNGAYGDGGTAQVGPINCGTQEEPSTVPVDPRCMQLRIYDSLPGLTNGMGQNGAMKPAGVGEGMLCMACHNSATGEHTDTFNTAPYAETPGGMSTVADALFGFNTFFMPRFNPSPHLAVSDTCTGCHMKLVTAPEADAGLTSNHSFATDLSICKNCHTSGSVDGVSIQATVGTELTALNSAVGSTMSLLAVNWNKTNPLCVQASITDLANCPTSGTCLSSQVVSKSGVPTTPAANVYIPVGAVSGFTNSRSSTLNLIAGSGVAQFAYYDAADGAMANPIAANAATNKSVANPASLTVYNYGIVVMPVGGTLAQCNAGIVPVPSATLPAALFPMQDVAGAVTSTIPAKANWNYSILNSEDSKGIHNYPWTTGTINATMNQLWIVSGGKFGSAN
jgi:hypothetical protein